MALTQVKHHLRTFTNEKGATFLYDQAFPTGGVYIVGKEGVDGLYTVPLTGTGQDVWVDIKDGVKEPIGYELPNTITVYDASDVPITTISFPAPTPTES